MKRFLESLHIDCYGAMADRDIGPFAPGLNVVFGPNEAGKSTVVSFVGSVLFGWEEAHGLVNTYNPGGDGRAGTLTFSDGEVARRTEGADALQGAPHVVADLDKATFKTMFSLTSDELLSLRSSSNVTARLLTAGAGTGSSPAGAFVEVEQRIAVLTSKEASAKDSVFNLADKLDAQRAQVKAAGDETERRKREHLELRALKEDRQITARHLSDVVHELEKLNTCRTRVEQIDAQAEEMRREATRAKLEREERENERAARPNIDPRLLRLDNAAERSLRDRLDEFADEQAKAARGVDMARENATASSASYEALMEMDSESVRTNRIRNSRVLLPAALAAAFALAGVPVIVHARAINSLSLTALGIGLVVFACLLAIATVALVARPDRSDEAHSSRQQDAQWVMLQDKKKLDTSTAAKQLLDQDIATFLADAGLEAAHGSIRQARALLDDAREARSEEQAFEQRMASLDMRLATSSTALDDLAAERRLLLEQAGFDDEASLEDIDREIDVKKSQREALSKTCDDMALRIGELTERLENARTDRTFDRVKLTYQQTRVRLRDAKRELVTLLLAKRMLERSIIAWESRSQPEIYRTASELFATVTDGTWTRIAMTSEGRLVATAADGAVREVRHLSLGTCQQLYLSLRVAMLLHADNVGASIPVMADDILVNFDDDRRRGAAHILAELAKRRQVIVFTCHRESVDALRDAQADLNYLELSS